MPYYLFAHFTWLQAHRAAALCSESRRFSFEFNLLLKRITLKRPGSSGCSNDRQSSRQDNLRFACITSTCPIRCYTALLLSVKALKGNLAEIMKRFWLELRM